MTGALRSHFLAHGYDTDADLKAMVPVSVRADSERGALGNKVAAIYAPLPIGLEDPIARFRAVHEAMSGLKESGQAVGAETHHRAGGLRAADDPLPGRAHPGRAALLQRDRHERARPAVPALPARPAAAQPVPARPDRRELRARHRDHVLRRPHRLRPRVRLRRASRSRRPRRGVEAAIAELAAVAGAPAPTARSRRPRVPGSTPDGIGVLGRHARTAHASRSPRSTRASATSRATPGWCASTSRGRVTPAPSWCCSPSWC